MTIDGKTYTLHTNEDGSITFRPLGEKQQPRKPQPWDVYYSEEQEGVAVRNGDGLHWGCCVKDGSFVEGRASFETVGRYVGNLMDLVKGEYVRKADVIAALSHEDTDGECVLDLIASYSLGFGADQTHEALKALGITKEEGK